MTSTTMEPATSTTFPREFGDLNEAVKQEAFDAGSPAAREWLHAHPHQWLLALNDLAARINDQLAIKKALLESVVEPTPEALAEFAKWRAKVLSVKTHIDARQRVLAEQQAELRRADGSKWTRLRDAVRAHRLHLEDAGEYSQVDRELWDVLDELESAPRGSGSPV